MGKRGPQPKGKVNIEWSSNFAYAIGLLASDGNISKDGRIITLVSKDLEQLENFMRALDIDVHVGTSSSGYTENRAFRIQFGDVLFHQFLRNIGISPNKSKTIGELKIPPEYFFDFLRGSFDGDGSVHSYWDKRWRSSFMFYTIFASASKKHIFWLQSEILKSLGITGHITGEGRVSTLQLKYAKSDSLKLLHKLYPTRNVLSLSRKRLKIENILGIVGQSLFENSKS